jgi:cysteine synthase A
MGDHSRYHIAGAFVLGAVVALGFCNLRQHDRDAAAAHQLGQQRELVSKLSEIKDSGAVNKSMAHVEAGQGTGVAKIKEGIEGCIGGTPLIKIKSLSEATGCEILAKAEASF